MRMKWKAIRKKTALLLSAALLAGMVAENGSDLGKVYAAGSAPSVTSFATKDELQTEFDCDGVDDTVGRLRFGKNTDGEPQIWYIAGTDSGVTGENIVLFAAEAILGKSDTDGTTLDGSKFTINSDEQRAYDTEWNCQYSDNPTLSQVNRNYYGGSDLRVKLQEIAKSESYFTKAEQNLMNETTITTWDTLNEKTYTTTDKLYALSIKDVNTCYIGEDLPNNINITKIYAGSGNNIEISSEVYLVDPPNSYWLRSPLGHKSNAGVGVVGYEYYLNVAIVTMRGVVSYNPSGYKCVVRPAANLNLTNVLFASAAEAASQEPTARMITDETPMVLRLDGAGYGKAIGTVEYDETQGLIVAQKDANATGTVSLVVQGNDGTQGDWYYSVIVDGSAVVTKEQLQKALSLSTVNFADCRIWLETTEDNVTYATALATERTQTQQPIEKTTVSKVELTGVKPVGGMTLADKATCTTAGIAAESLAISYTVGNTAPATGIAGWDTVYSASFTLHTGLDGNQAYVFADDVEVTVDGNTIGLLNPDQYGRLSGGWAFQTDQRKITDVVAPTIPNGGVFSSYYTAADVLTNGANGEFGTQADVTLEGTADVTAEQLPMDVEWTLDGGADYDATPGAKNIFRWTVKPDAYLDYDVNNNKMTGTYEITNQAATPVSITGTDESRKFDGTDIDVSKYFTIDKNAGAATYSLEAGGTGKGTLKGTTLTVTQTGTFLIKVSTAAIGNYAAGEKTITLTVDKGSIVSTATDYSGIYDGQPHSITVSVTEPSDVNVTYSTDGTNFGTENPTFTEAGSYNVTYKIEKENYTAVTGTKTVTIEKRDLEIKAEDQTIPWGTKVDQTKYKLSVNALADGDHIADITLTPSTTERTENATLTVGGVKIMNAANEDVTDSYKISTVQGVLKITHNTTLAPKRIEAVKTKTVYKEGDVLNLDDLTVTAYYADGYSEAVTGYTTNAADIDMSIPEEKTLTVSFTQNGETRTKDIILTVDAVPRIVDAVTLTGVKPVGGTRLADNAACNTAGIAAESLAISYTVGNTAPATNIAEWDTEYSASVTLRTAPDGGRPYVFADHVTVTVDGVAINVAPDANGSLHVTQKFTTDKRKITKITAPTILNGGVFSEYYTAADVLTSSELGKQAEVTLEETADVTAVQLSMDVEWTLENAGGADYDATPGAKNIFRWTVKPDAYQDYDEDNHAMTGTYEIANQAATPVSITGKDKSLEFNGVDIDVSKYFTIDENAGAATYSLEAGGTGKGTLKGTTLTVTQTGTFLIKVSTAAIGNYAAGEKTITLTVDEGSIVSTATDYSGTYDGQPHSITVSVTEPSDVNVTYSTDGTNFGTENPTFTEAGSYEVEYKIEKENYTAVTGTKTVTIEKRDLEIKAEDQTIPWGTEVDQTKYILSGNALAAGDHIADITLTPSTTERTENATLTVGGVKIMNAADEDVTESYKISTVPGVLKITHNTTLAPEGIEAVKTKTVYKEGDVLNLDDLTVTAFYADGYSEAVTGYTTNAADIDMSIPGEKTLTVSFTRNGETRTKDIILTVDAVPLIVDAVELTGVKPVGGTRLADNAACNTAGIAEESLAISYTVGNTAPATGIAEWDTEYSASVTLRTAPDGGRSYVFADHVTVTVDGVAINVAPDANGSLHVTQKFTTDERKITGIAAPTIPNGGVFSNYYTAADVLTSSELGTQADVTLEGTTAVAEKTQPMDVEWTLANAGGADYDATSGAKNTFRWTVKPDAYQDYDTGNHAMTGTCEIANRAAAEVSIAGTDERLNFSGTDVDVSKYFTIDPNAGAATYSLEAGGTGKGTLNGTVLTVTQAGTFLIKVSTAANGNYAAGEKTITLTVDEGSIVSTATDYSGIYDGQPHSITVSVTEPSDVNVTYSTDGTNFGTENPKFTEAGSYNVTYKIEKENYTAVTGTKTVTIEKRDLEIKAEDQMILWGTAIDQTKYILSGNALAAGDHIADITLTPSTTERTENAALTVGGVKIMNAADEDVTESYKISTVPGVLKITHNTTLAPDRIEAVKLRTVYKKGDVLNLDDLTVTAYYADGYSETVTDYTTNAADIDMSVSGEKTLTVSFTRNGETRTKDIILTVDAVPLIVDAVELTGVKPVGGMTLAENAECNTAGIATDTLTLSYATVSGGDNVTATGIAEWNTEYSASAALRTASDGDRSYVFADHVAVTIDGVAINVAPDANGSLHVTQKFTTDKRKITGIAVPAVPNNLVFSNYYTASDVLTNGGNAELGTQADVTLEGTTVVAEKTQPMDVEWTLANAGGADYDATSGAVNTFRWTVKPDAYQDYDTGNHAMTGTCEIANRAATPVSIAGRDGSVAFDGTDIDVSKYFTIDPNAGTATYSLEGGTGVGTLNGTTLTVTQAGTFLIRVSTAASGNYAPGEETITLTVGVGGIVSTAGDYSGIYDGQPHSITVSVAEPSDANVTYSTDGTNFGMENPTFTEAGSYNVTYKIEKENYTAVTGTKTVTIEKRDLEIKAEDQTIPWGTAVDETKYTVSTVSGNDLAAGDRIAGITLTPSTSERTENGTLAVGDVKIVNAVGGDVTGSYKVSTVQGVLKITHNTTLAPDGIEAAKARTAYKAGDVLNLDDLTVTAYYADGYSEVVTGYTTNAADIDMSVPEAKILRVSLTQNGVTRTKDIVLTVDALPLVHYTITATAGANGKVTPEGTVTVMQGGSQTFTIIPNSGYVIDTLTIDGSAVAVSTSYTFSGIASNHSISVTFKPEPPVITLQPSDTSVKAGAAAVFRVKATGTKLAYQWQVDRNDKKGWVNISRAEAAELTLKAVEQSQDSFRYRCIISNSSGSVTSNEVKLTVVPVNVEYKVIEGADSTFTLGEDESLTIRVDAELGKFLGVEMDGWTVDPANYTSWSGSTYVKFTKDYLNTQAVGTHTVKILFSDGYAITTVTIARNEQQNGEGITPTPAPTPSEEITVPAGNTDKAAPKTGDNSIPIMVCVAVMVVCGAVLVIFGVARRREDK